jgi:hypothetical protein
MVWEEGAVRIRATNVSGRAGVLTAPLSRQVDGKRPSRGIENRGGRQAHAEQLLPIFARNVAAADEESSAARDHHSDIVRSQSHGRGHLAKTFLVQFHGFDQIAALGGLAAQVVD